MSDDYHVGALRGPNPHDPDKWIEANPGDMLFSTLCFFATEVWDGVKWTPVFEPKLEE